MALPLGWHRVCAVKAYASFVIPLSQADEWSADVAATWTAGRQHGTDSELSRVRRTLRDLAAKLVPGRLLQFPVLVSSARAVALIYIEQKLGRCASLGFGQP